MAVNKTTKTRKAKTKKPSQVKRHVVSDLRYKILSIVLSFSIIFILIYAIITFDGFKIYTDNVTFFNNIFFIVLPIIGSFGFIWYLINSRLNKQGDSARVSMLETIIFALIIVIIITTLLYFYDDWSNYINNVMKSP
jgi:hypothetical protein